MSKDTVGWATLVGTVISLILLGVGAGMWSDAPTPADAAVGKGLVTLGACATLVTLTLLAAAVSSAPRTPQPADRSDWDDT